MVYILFGAGKQGKRCAAFLGESSIRYFVDNDDNKRDVAAAIPIFSFSEKLSELKQTSDEIVITVSTKFEQTIMAQLEAAGIHSYRTWDTVRAESIRKRIEGRPDYIEAHMRAVQWMRKHTTDGQGVFNNSQLKSPYPEVTGYFIPSLLRWGQRDLAISYAKWLCSIQKEDGSWYDTTDKAPYVFDSAQILKGLLAIREILPEVDGHIRKGCDWILGNMQSDGRLATPTQEAWGDERTCSELIHIYCLSPLRDAGKVFNEPRYETSAYKILCYYMETYREQILHFSLLSHFHAYVMEGLLDMGAEGMARAAMANMAAFQKEDGSVPAYHNVNWVCSTGLFQLAIVWFRLGDLERGKKAFAYARSLQSESGGWFGSYIHPDFPNEKNDYFPESEISWAVKYYLDALYYQNALSFERGAYRYIPYISREDERYQTIRGIVAEASNKGTRVIKVLDVGCGKGRYLRNLMEDSPNNEYYAVDLYLDMLAMYLHGMDIITKEGTLTNIPYLDNTFDVVYACESLEHAIDTDAAIRELARVVKPGGRIVLIDKTKRLLGTMQISDYEQWFDEEELKNMLIKYCSKVTIQQYLHYDGEKDSIKGLFVAWVGELAD